MGKIGQNVEGLEAMVGLQIDWRTAATAFKRVKKDRSTRAPGMVPTLIFSDWVERSKVRIAEVLKLPDSLPDWCLVRVNAGVSILVCYGCRLLVVNIATPFAPANIVWEVYWCVYCIDHVGIPFQMHISLKHLT